MQKKGKTPVIVSDEKNALGILIISDKIKDDAARIAKELKDKNIEVIMLTGDNKNTAEYVSKKVGIERFYGEVLPKEKGEIIQKLKSEESVVAMVGDGINDAPALAYADVGIAMSTGTDIAIDSADLVLLNGDIGKIKNAIELSEKTIVTIKQNLFWAFFYNTLGIPLAAGVFYPFFGILLNPTFAGMVMAFSSVSVVLNSLRLKKIKIH